MKNHTILKHVVVLVPDRVPPLPWLVAGIDGLDEVLEGKLSGCATPKHEKWCSVCGHARKPSSQRPM